jgi:hypothetical protein
VLYLLAGLRLHGKTASTVWCGSLPAFPRKRGGCRMPRASKEAHGKRRPTRRNGRKRPHAEASEDWTLEVVLARR